MNNKPTGRRKPAGRGAALPRVVSVEASLVRYATPRRFFLGRQLKEVSQGVEILVRTAAGLPVRSNSPVLFVGDVPVADYETVADNLYRFFIIDFERLPIGAPISLGWPNNPAAKVLTNFRFTPDKTPRIA